MTPVYTIRSSWQTYILYDESLGVPTAIEAENLTLKNIAVFENVPYFLPSYHMVQEDHSSRRTPALQYCKETINIAISLELTYYLFHVFNFDLHFTTSGRSRRWAWGGVGPEPTPQNPPNPNLFLRSNWSQGAEEINFQDQAPILS